MYLYMTVSISGISEAFPLNCLAVTFRVPAEEDLGQHSTPKTRPCTPHPSQPHLCHPGATGDAVMVQQIALPHVKSHLLWLPKSLLPSHLNPTAPLGGGLRSPSSPPNHTVLQNPICVHPIGAAPPVPPPFSMLGSSLPGGGKRLCPLGGGHKAALSPDPAAVQLRPWKR